MRQGRDLLEARGLPVGAAAVTEKSGWSAGRRLGLGLTWRGRGLPESVPLESVTTVTTSVREYTPEETDRQTGERQTDRLEVRGTDSWTDRQVYQCAVSSCLSLSTGSAARQVTSL